LFKDLVQRRPETPMYAVVPEDLWTVVRREGEVAQVFAELGRRSLIDVDETGAERRYRIHRLTQAVIRRRLEGKAQGWAETAAAVVAAGYPGGRANPQYSENWPACRGRNGHVAALHVLEGAVRPRGAAMHYLYNQASIYHDAQRQDAVALAYAEASLEIVEAQVPPDPRELGAAYTNLAIRLGRVERFEAAEAAAAKAVEIGERHDLPQANMAIRLSNHGMQLRELAGREGAAERRAALFAQARARYISCVLLEREAHGVVSRDVASSLNNLGGLHHAAGRAGKAVAMHRAALSKRRRLVAAGRMAAGDPDLGFSLNNLGGTLLRAGRLAEAEPLLAEALAIWSAAYDVENPAHQSTRATAGWLAICLAARDRLEGGAARAGRVRALCKERALDPAFVAERAERYAAVARAREGAA
ncbi:MAG: tetratricopeptide repeat protein, partial [Pseudomonadota bacterium]